MLESDCFSGFPELFEQTVQMVRSVPVAKGGHGFGFLLVRLESVGVIIHQHYMEIRIVHPGF